MANSKSNIYPIQLQGAELCLNRYDAEIKQYSGFNKNNSPFVGGCLSNVFTKEEQISGGNADNTYIDTNGDIYTVDSEGFYKNGKKIIPYNSNIKFYEKKKLNVDNYAAKVLTEKIYIIEKDGSYWACWGDGFTERLGVVNTDEDSFLDINYVNGVIVFSYKRYYWNSDLYVYLYWVIVPDENEERHFRTGRQEGHEGDTGGLHISVHLFKDNEVYRFYPQGVYIRDMGDDDNFYIYISANEDNGSYNTHGNSYNYGFYLVHLQKSSDIIDECPCGQIKLPSGVEIFLPSPYLCSYYMTNDGVFHFTHLPYKNEISGYRTRTCPTVELNQHFLMHSNIRLSTEVFHQSGMLDYLIYYESTVLNLSCPNYTADTTLSGTTFRNKQSKGEVYYNDSNNCLSNYGVFFINHFVDNSDDTKNFIFNFCDNLSSKFLKNGKLDGGFHYFGDFKILYNEGELTNISVKCLENWGGILLEDWNTVENVVIPQSGDRVVYKSGNSFYEISRTNKPKIYKKFNQLVVNCNSELNSYNLELSKIVKYGDDWNCSYLDERVTVQYSQESDVSMWLASAVNEYKRELNSSLIINAKEYYGTYPTVNMASIRDRNPVCCVNIYAGYNTPPEYRHSSTYGNRLDRDLIGLPFPNNTDGNVPYNPNLFSDFISNFGTDIFVRNNKNTYQLMKDGQQNVMSYFLGTLVEGLEIVFIIQGQYYGIINNKIFSLQFQNGVTVDSTFIVNIQGLQYVGNTPYEAMFFSKTNRCLYSFTGANVLNQKQLVDKISEVKNYLYNPATQTVFLITDIGVLFYGLFGIFLLEYTDINNIFLLDKGIVLIDNLGNYRYVKYYLDEGDEGYTKENIRLETCFYGMNNETVTINDCLYFRLFSEEHEEGDLKVSATTISLSGRKTEETTFKIKASDWDKITHTIYMRYQPKTQRGLGVSFSIDSPFKIASLSVGSQPDAILVDKVSKGAINAPSVTSNNDEW